jgi:hypothetical protein
MKLELGVSYDLPPIPYDPEYTRFFEAGAVQIGVEYRVLDAAAITASFTEEQRSQSAIDQVKDGSMPTTDGVSLHVCDSSGAEYLRFDCFSEDPHYHYIWPGERNLAVAYDIAANGDMLAWSIQRLNDRFATMLAISSPPLAAAADPEAVREVLPEIRAYAESIRHQPVVASS